MRQKTGHLYGKVHFNLLFKYPFKEFQSMKLADSPPTQPSLLNYLILYYTFNVQIILKAVQF